MKYLSVEKRRPPLTTIFLWTVGVVTLVLTGYGVFTGVVLILLFPYNILIVINSIMIGIIEIFVGAPIDMHALCSMKILFRRGVDLFPSIFLNLGK